MSTGTGKIGKDELQWSREGTGEQGVQRRQESPGNRLLAREPVKAALASPQLIYHLSYTWAAGQ